MEYTSEKKLMLKWLCQSSVFIDDELILPRGSRTAALRTRAVTKVAVEADFAWSWRLPSDLCVSSPEVNQRARQR